MWAGLADYSLEYRKGESTSGVEKPGGHDLTEIKVYMASDGHCDSAVHPPMMVEHTATPPMMVGHTATSMGLLPKSHNSVS